MEVIFSKAPVFLLGVTSYEGSFRSNGEKQGWGRLIHADGYIYEG
jgi:hypothetical protein